MKTTWQEIKDRVELKIGEDMDMSEFAVLANESISDLQEVAMVKAPVMHYGAKDIMTEDEEFEFNKFDLPLKGAVSNDKEYLALDLPFTYNVGYNELTLTASSDKLPKIYFKEDEEFTASSIIYIKNDPRLLAFLESKEDLTYTVTRKTMSVVGKQSSMNELVIDKPNNLFRPIDLKIINNVDEVFGAEFTSSTNPMDKDYRRGTKTNSAYYVDNGKIHIFTEICNVKAISLVYYKTMDKVKREIAADQQIVELEPGFENLLTFAICHKWLENFVGVDDQETQTMYGKYRALKQEYENTAKQRKSERRQTRIIEVY